MSATLEKPVLMERVALLHADIPREIVELVIQLLLDDLGDALAEGLEVSLRGFGRLIPRYYENSANKRLGLLFHPSPRLAERCNNRAARPLRGQ